jgi:hypothetical protein
VTEHTITIETNAKFRPRRFLLTIAAQIGVIGVGIWAESAAMQWCGFSVLALMLIGLAAKDKRRGLTFDEARMKIDQIETESN